MGYKLLVSLSSEQLEHRRYLLNQAGFIAWLSPIFILLGIYISRLTLRSMLPRSNSNPQSKSKSKSQPKIPSPFLHVLRRLSWFLQHTSPPSTPEFGPWAIPLAGALYTAYLLTLATRHTGEDYMHLTKSLAHVAAANLPFHYLLAVKSPNSPITLTTGLTHEALNDYHRLLGRILHGLLAAHAALYLNFFVRLGVLEQRLQAPVVRLGVLAFGMLNVLGLLALPVVRRKMYHALFYRGHVLLSAALLGLLWAHVPYTRWYVGQAALFWVANGLVRWKDSTDVSAARVVKVEGTELIRLRVTVPGNSKVLEYVPGQHVYVKRASGIIGPKTPFTIVRVDAGGMDGGGNPTAVLELVIRNLHGPQTGWLARKQSVDVVLEGPYGEASEYIPALLRDGADTGKILLVAGGVGATYTLPIYLALLANRRSSAGVSFVWVVRSLDEARWGVEMLNSSSSLPDGADVDVDVYITRNEEGAGSTLSTGKVRGGLRVHALGKRPRMADMLGRTFTEQVGKKGGKSSETGYEPVTVLACGPPGMSNTLKKELGGM